MVGWLEWFDGCNRKSNQCTKNTLIPNTSITNSLFSYLRPMKWRWKIAQFFEAWWWKLYLSQKSVEDYLQWKRTYWQNFIQKEKIDVLPTDKVLDAGCGPAGINIVLGENDLTAIDPLLDKYKKEISHFQEDRYPNVVFKKMGLEELAAKKQFEKIFCLNVINHVDDLEKSVFNLCEALKNNGVIYMSVDAHRNSFLKSILRLIPYDILHPHQLDLNEYKMLLEKNGIKIEKVSLIKKESFFDYYLLTGKKMLL